MLKVKEIYLEQITSISYVNLDNVSNATIEIMKELFDLGTIQQGKSATVTTIIHNIGEEPLIVHNIETSCDCTTVEYKG